MQNESQKWGKIVFVLTGVASLTCSSDFEFACFERFENFSDSSRFERFEQFACFWQKFACFERFEKCSDSRNCLCLLVLAIRE